MFKFVKCDRLHEKHVPQMMVLYRLCAAFTLGSLVGLVISILS
jgi:hypothetical protein